MNGSMAARRPYLELTALLIEREMAKFRRGEQTALVSFSNVALLAGNAREELMAQGRGNAPSLPLRQLASAPRLRPANDQAGAVHWQGPEFGCRPLPRAQDQTAASAGLHVPTASVRTTRCQPTAGLQIELGRGRVSALQLLLIAL
jgi:hypothetical protein